jgi:HlyD family secretion protein
VRTASKATAALAAVVLAASATWGQVVWTRRSLPPVWTEPVERREVAATLTIRGRLRPARTRTLRTQVTGRVGTILVRTGQRVRAGDPLVVLDSTPLRLELSQRRAALAIADGKLAAERAALEAADTGAVTVAGAAERQEQLFALGLASQAGLASARHDRSVALLAATLQRQRVDEAVARGRAELALAAAAARALSGLVERSPVDGVVADVPVQRGQWVHEGGPHVIPTPLVTVASVDMAVEVVVEQTAEIRLPAGWPGTMVLDAEPTRRWPARVTTVGPTSGRGATIRLELLERPHNVRDGMSCTVHVTTASRAHAIAVPNYALLSLHGMSGVWTVTRGVIAARAVTLGLRGDVYSEVLAGVEPGQRVVTGPHAVLRTVRAGDAVAEAAPQRLRR